MLVSSDCDSDFTASIVEAVGQPPVCDYQLSQNGTSVTAVACDDNTVTETVDTSGTLRLGPQQSVVTQQGCTVRLSVEISTRTSRVSTPFSRSRRIS